MESPTLVVTTKIARSWQQYPSVTPSQSKLSDVYATLAISEDEARNGTTRTLTLSGGQRISVSIPPGTHEGQVIELDDAGKPVSLIPNIGSYRSHNCRSSDRTRCCQSRLNPYDQTIASTPYHQMQGSEPGPPCIEALLSTRHTQCMNMLKVVMRPHLPTPVGSDQKTYRLPIGLAILMVVLALLIIARWRILFRQGE